MIRKILKTSTGPDIVNRWHWDESAPNPETGLPGRWILLSDTFDVRTYKRAYRDITDDPKWFKPCMQDLIQTTCGWNHALVSRMGIYMSENPSLNARLYNIGFPGECAGLTDGYVIGNLVDDLTGLPWDPMQEVWLGSQALYDQLGEEPYRKRVKHLEDPIDSDFSIWYLLTDIKETAKLVKGFVKNANRIKSIFHSTPTLRAIFGRATMKEVSSSHLAVQYGLLPTIADIRDFANVVLKWYQAWVTRKYDLGSVRTYHAPVKVYKEAQGPIRRRLRFLAFGAGYHYVNVDVNPGHIMSHQTVKYYFICPELTDAMSRLRLTIDLLGILDPAVLWDKVPFSFVIDWFVDVTSIFHKMKPRLFHVSLVIADWAESLLCVSKLEGNLEYLGTTDLFRPEENTPHEPMFECTLLQRVRRRQFPRELQIDSVAPFGKGLTLRRVINGLAIIVNRDARSNNPPRGTNYRKRSQVK